MIEQRVQGLEVKMKDVVKRVGVLEKKFKAEESDGSLKMPWEKPPQRKEGN